MRPLVVPLMLLLWALAAHADPLPGFLDSHEYERRLPSANLPMTDYAPVSPRIRLAGAAIDNPDWAPANTRLVLQKCASRAARCSPWATCANTISR